MINPVRYPGGKGSRKMAERVCGLYPEGYFSDKTWVEPFAGGCGLGLYLLEHDIVSHCVFNDFDPRVRDMWHAIAYHTDRMIMSLDRLKLDIDRFHKARRIMNDPSSTAFQRGYNTFIVNRCARSGYLDGGVIGGNAQDGKYKLDCRFTKENLIKKIEHIGDLAESGKIAFTSGYDGADMVERHLGIYSNPFVYLDPPYYDKGKQCYRARVDHANLARVLLSEDEIPWLLSYDLHPYIMGLYEKQRMEDVETQYSNNTFTRGKAREMLIMSERKPDAEDDGENPDRGQRQSR